MKKEFKIFVFFLILTFLFVIIILERQKKGNRINNSDVTIGVIINKSSVAKGQKYVDYEFEVESKVYKGSMNIKFCNECKTACCNLGSKVKVRYEKGNPDNNDLIH